MSTTTICDYPECRRTATFTVESRRISPKPFRYSVLKDACDEHVQLIHVWPSSFVGWALLPVEQPA